jgi:hypothetical protein
MYIKTSKVYNKIENKFRKFCRLIIFKDVYKNSLYHEFSVKYCYKYEQKKYMHSWATTRISAGLYWKKVSFIQDLKFFLYSYSLYREFSVKYCYTYEQMYINLQTDLIFFVHSWATTRISAGLYWKKDKLY